MFFFLGGFLLIIGIVLFFAQKDQKKKAFSLKVAETFTISDLHRTSQEIAQEIGPGNWREYVKVRGKVKCDEPLTSPLAEKNCVYYSMSVSREYEETVTNTDEDGNTTRETERNSETLSSDDQSIPFTLRDSTGAIAIDPSDADIETVSVLDEFRPQAAPGGMLSFGRFSLTLGEEQLSGNRRTLGYRYSEDILPLDRDLFVLAMASDGEGSLRLQKPTEHDRKFLLSLKSEDELIANAESSAKTSFTWMLVCLIGGVALILLGLVTS